VFLLGIVTSCDGQAGSAGIVGEWVQVGNCDYNKCPCVDVDKPLRVYKEGSTFIIDDQADYLVKGKHPATLKDGRLFVSFPFVGEVGFQHVEVTDQLIVGGVGLELNRLTAELRESAAVPHAMKAVSEQLYEAQREYAGSQPFGSGYSFTTDLSKLESKHGFVSAPDVTVTIDSVITFTYSTFWATLTHSTGLVWRVRNDPIMSGLVVNALDDSDEDQRCRGV
jgi:hypothetical protein